MASERVGGGPAALTDQRNRRIAEAVAAMGGTTVSKLGLRFDRVAVRVLDRFQHSMDAQPRTDVSVLLTLTAPICAPGKTTGAVLQEIRALLRAGGPGERRSIGVHGNRAELRLVGHEPKLGQALLGFVHNPNVDAATILDLAEQWLQSGG